jgi:hypothetical protein
MQGRAAQAIEQGPSMHCKASRPCLACLILCVWFMSVWGRLWVFNVNLVLIKVHEVIIECFGHTLFHFNVSHIFQTIPFQPTKLHLKSLSPGKLKWTCYDNGVMSLASIFLGL